MIFIGDIHGNFESLKRIIDLTDDDIICVGDLGIGIPGQPDTEFPSHFKFIRGNHDNPEICQTHPNYLGDFGIYKGIFFISGAASIDRKTPTRSRIPGFDFFPNEELTREQFNNATDLFCKERPKIVVSHDGPWDGLISCFTEKADKWEDTKTRIGLQLMLGSHAPDLWIFGHHHCSKRVKKFGVEWVCLDELDIYKH